MSTQIKKKIEKAIPTPKGKQTSGILKDERTVENGYYTVVQVSKIIKQPTYVVYNAINAGKLKCTREFRGKTWIHINDMKAWMEVANAALTPILKEILKKEKKGLPLIN